MNGRMSKQLHKVAANPQIPEATTYKAIEHPIVQYRIVTTPEGLQKIEPYGVTRIQVVLANCQRKMYKVWKERYKGFIQRSKTLPHRGLQVKAGG